MRVNSRVACTTKPLGNQEEDVLVAYGLQDGMLFHYLFAGHRIAPVQTLRMIAQQLHETGRRCRRLVNQGDSKDLDEFEGGALAHSL
ncbi:MAG: hypothetical protein D6704_01090 [Nitrospirae bacterium]|nr:MAG: hypothetical protein D6704_01090 [Nitrospirota bacterium]